MALLSMNKVSPWWILQTAMYKVFGDNVHSFFSQKTAQRHHRSSWSITIALQRGQKLGSYSVTSFQDLTEILSFDDILLPISDELETAEPLSHEVMCLSLQNRMETHCSFLSGLGMDATLNNPTSLTELRSNIIAFLPLYLNFKADNRHRVN